MDGWLWRRHLEEQPGLFSSAVQMVMAALMKVVIEVMVRKLEVLMVTLRGWRRQNRLKEMVVMQLEMPGWKYREGVNIFDYFW